MNNDPVFFYIISVTLSALFFTSTWQKLQNRAEFVGILDSYQILHKTLLNFFARAIPSIELAIAAGLLIPDTRTLSAVLAAALLLGYATAIAFNIYRGNKDIDCGCSYGTSRQTISMGLVWRNLILATGAASLMLPTFFRPLGYFDYAMILFGVIQFSVMYLTINTLIGQQMTSRELAL